MRDRISWLAAVAGVWLAGPVLAAEPAPPADAGWHNRQMLALLERSAQDGWQTSASGLRWRKLSGTGDGRRPVVSDSVVIHYTGRFIDGTVFDSSVERGEPATFPLRRLIKGWQEGVPMMQVGETYEFAIPQHLAYGPKGRGPIPGGATLLFTIALIDIAPPAAEAVS